MKTNNLTTDMEELEKEIESRISIMENEDYTFPKQLSKREYIFIGFFCLFCLLCIVGGAFL